MEKQKLTEGSIFSLLKINAQIHYSEEWINGRYFKTYPHKITKRIDYENGKYDIFAVALIDDKESEHSVFFSIEDTNQILPLEMSIPWKEKTMR